MVDTIRSLPTETDPNPPAAPQELPREFPVVQAWRTSKGQLYCRHSDGSYRVLLPYIAEGAEYELVRALGYGDLVYAISQRQILDISVLEPKPAPPSTSLLLGLVRTIGFVLAGVAFLVAYVLTFVLMMVLVPALSLISMLADAGEYNVAENAPPRPAHWSDRALSSLERRVSYFTKDPEDFVCGAGMVGGGIFCAIMIVVLISWCGCEPIAAAAIAA